MSDIAQENLVVPDPSDVQFDNAVIWLSSVFGSINGSQGNFAESAGKGLLIG